MDPNNLENIVINIKKLVEEVVFLKKSLKTKLLKKLNNNLFSRENLIKLQNLLEKIIHEETNIIEKTLEKDPLFFKNLKYKIAQQKLKMKLIEEEKSKTIELQKIEQELDNFLIN
jgi:hypothetical protein